MTTPWDIVDHLRSDSEMAGYLEAAMEDDDIRMVAVALGDIARAKGMTEIAEQTGLGRQSVYDALTADGDPRFAAVLRAIDALGFRLAVKPKAKRRP